MREIIKDHINDFASKEIQYEAWFIRDKLWSSPNEDYCMLFNDRAIEKYVCTKDNYLTKRENDALKKFIDILNNYANKHKDEKGFLNFDSKKVFYDSEWEAIRQEAKNLCLLLEKEEGIEDLKFIEDWHYVDKR